jgi:hypothetical protein
MLVLEKRKRTSNNEKKRLRLEIAYSDNTRETGCIFRNKFVAVCIIYKKSRISNCQVLASGVIISMIIRVGSG